MKIHKLFVASMLILLASCSSEVGEVLPDGSGEINVALSKGISTRAETGYRAWNANTDPTTMGVIAFTNGTPNTYIYNNVSFQHTSESVAWDITSGTKAKWNTYNDATALDFFAYMPYMTDDATVSKSESTYTLTLTNVPGISATPYLVSTTPVHYASAFGNLTPVPFQMDQLMTAFEFQFALGDKMGSLRTFKITKVEMSHVITSATVSQVYTLTDGAWSKGEVTIHPASDHNAFAEVTGDIKVGYINDDKTAFVSFPNMLYMLPFSLSEHSPKIEVTYDVYDQDGYKTDSRTREIVLNEANFGTLSSVQSAHKNIVKIKIVPNVLHVLSDADQSTSGYLVVGT